jgi:hypothetical protein
VLGVVLQPALDLRVRLDPHGRRSQARESM